MISRKDWQTYKKKNNIPDGVHKKISLGDVLEKYGKSRQTDDDLAKLEKAIKDYAAAAKTDYPKAANYLTSSLNSEIAARQEAEANAPKVKPRATGASAKFYARLAKELGKYHANISALAALVASNPDWFEKKPSENVVAKRDQVLQALDKELEAMFKFCRDEGGDTVDISLAFYNRLRGVADQTHKELKTNLKECLEMVKETADHILEKL